MVVANLIINLKKNKKIVLIFIHKQICYLMNYIKLVVFDKIKKLQTKNYLFNNLLYNAFY